MKHIILIVALLGAALPSLAFGQTKPSQMELHVLHEIRSLRISGVQAGQLSKSQITEIFALTLSRREHGVRQRVIHVIRDKK